MTTSLVALTLLAALTYVGSVALSLLNASGASSLFHHPISELDSKYYQYVSPAGIAFGIAWSTIYLWNLVAMAYLVYTLMLPDDLSPVKRVPTLVSKSYLVLFIVGWIGTVGWLFAFDRENLELSLTMLLLSVISFYFALGISYKLVYDNEAKLQKNMLWPMRILVQNGLALPATWLTVASLIGLADVLIYKNSPDITPPVMRGGLSVSEGSTVSLGILVGVTICWFILENFALDKYVRYTFTIYPVLILALAALVSRLQEIPEAEQNLVLTIIALALVILAFLAKIAIFIYRSTQAYLGSDIKKHIPLD